MLRHQPPAAMHLPLSTIRRGFGPNAPDESQFSAALENYLGLQACFTASSARTALFLLLKTLAETKPDRPGVLLPAYTCPALVKVILDVGLRPVPIDISPTTFTFDPTQLAQFLDQTVLAVIHVHPFGIPLPVEEISAQAHAVGAVLIEDAAQAMGARWQGRQVGTFGDFGLFSLGPGKPMSLAGGGLLCTNDQPQAQLLRQAWRKMPPPTGWQSLLGLTRALLIRLVTHPRGWWLAARVGSQRLGERPESWGYTLRPLSPFQNRIGPSQLAALDALNAVRFVNGRQLTQRLEKLPSLQIPPVQPEAEPIYLRLPLITKTAEHREKLYRRLWSANIGVGRLYRQSLPEIFPQLKEFHCPGAVEIGRRLLTLPTHYYITQTDLDHMVDLITQP